MNCPVCSKVMVQTDFGGVNAQVCANGCKGIWFEHGALEKVDENNEGMGKALEEALNSPRINDADRASLKCPACHMPMHQHKYFKAQEVNIDECYGCAAFFLDSGELSVIRRKAMTDAEVEAYTNRLVGDITGRPNEVFLDEQKIAQDDIFFSRRLSAINKLGEILDIHYWNS
ncbi:MAG: zf-TFIIB domain-containing protein [Candidatus Omnitrophica bacterium]|nr:zf-TFIIB domain-containing protein [Candidatus Omnitrophota bacterium]